MLWQTVHVSCALCCIAFSSFIALPVLLKFLLRVVLRSMTTPLSQIAKLQWSHQHQFLSHLRHCGHASCLTVRVTLCWLPTTHTRVAGRHYHLAVRNIMGHPTLVALPSTWVTTPCGFSHSKHPLASVLLGGGREGIWCSGVYFTLPWLFLLFFLWKMHP